MIVLSEELHFGRAAERLNISQPPLSRQIRLIERELGVQLFHRTKKEVRLTHAGQKFVDEARQVISQLNYAAQVAARADRGEIGHIKIGTVPTQKTLITKCVRVFAERFRISAWNSRACAQRDNLLHCMTKQSTSHS